MSKRMKIQLIIGVVVTGVVIYCAVIFLDRSKINLGDVLKMNVNWWLVLVSVAIIIYSNYIRGLAYSKGIAPDMDNMTSFEVISIGHALNMILPFRAGEGIRLALFPPSFSVALRTKLTVLTVLSDAIVVVVVTVLTIPLAHITDATVLKVVWIFCGVCVGVMAVGTVLVLTVKRLKTYIQEFLNISLLKMFMWVALSWIILIAAYWLGLVANGFSLLSSIQMALAIFVATNIISLVPGPPGSWGLYEYGTIVVLAGLGVERSLALSASLLLHLIQYMALLPLGAVLYIKALHGRYGEAIRGALNRTAEKALRSEGTQQTGSGTDKSDE